MANIDALLKELHETFLQLRYPSLVQASSGDIAKTILARENRLFLLSWILSLFKPEEFSNNHDEAKIIRWYSDLGICDNPDILMGRVPLAEQVSFLRNLLQFTNNIQSADESKIDSDSNDQLEVLDIYQEFMDENTNILPSASVLTKEMSYPEAIHYLDQCRESLNENDSVSNGEYTNEENNLPDETLDTTANSACTELSRKESVDKFLEGFQDISSWPKTEDSDKSVSNKAMDDAIDQLCANLDTLKQTFQSKDEISNSVIMKPLEVREMPLDAQIEDIVVAIEELKGLENMD